MAHGRWQQLPCSLFHGTGIPQVTQYWVGLLWKTPVNSSPWYWEPTGSTEASSKKTGPNWAAEGLGGAWAHVAGGQEGHCPMAVGLGKGQASPPIPPFPSPDCRWQGVGGDGVGGGGARVPVGCHRVPRSVPHGVPGRCPRGRGRDGGRGVGRNPPATAIKA